jgi:hypothetical protein
MCECVRVLKKKNDSLVPRFSTYVFDDTLAKTWIF